MNKTTKPQLTAEELRIGNLVQFNEDNSIAIVKSIYPKIIDAYFIEGDELIPFNIADFSGIIITEDILLKAGFEPLPYYTVNNSFELSIGRNRILSIGCVGTPNEMLVIRSPNDCIVLHNWDYDGSLYLHRLQNIASSLGTELEIKL